MGNLNRWIDRTVELAVVAIFMGVVIVGGLQVVFRFALNIPLNWSEEVQIFGHVWIVFLTVPIAYNRGSHIVMGMLLERLPARMQSFVGFAVDALWLWLGASIAIYTLRLVQVAAFQRSPALEIPMSTVYWGMVFGGAYLTFVALRKLAVRLHGGGGGVAAVDAPL